MNDINAPTVNETVFVTLPVEHPDEPPIIYLCDGCKVLAVLLYSFLSVVAFIGNCLIVAVIVYFRRLRTPTNMLIVNLAFADLLISIFCMPFSYWHVIIFEDQRWVFGALLCKLFNYLQATVVFLSSWTLVAISFDRFMAICFAMVTSPMSRRRALYLILATWLFSLLMALPLFFVNHTEHDPAADVEVCLENWEFLSFIGDKEKVVYGYTTTVFALQYCLPLIVLVITYTAIGLRMWNARVPGAERAGSMRCIVQERHESVKKLIPMVLLVSALYAGCWLPQNLLMNIWVSYDPSVTSHPYILYIWWGSHTLAMFHSIVNPFIYYWQNRRMREGVRYLLRFLPCIRFEGFRLLSEKSGTKAVKIVNMVAYMPVTGGKRIIHSTVSYSG